MNSEKLGQLKIDRQLKQRPSSSIWVIFFVVLIIAGVTLYYAWPRSENSQRVVGGGGINQTATAQNSPASDAKTPAVKIATTDERTVLTVSGHIINKERIELSPHYLGFVKWIGVKKGDTVTNGQVVVLLEDSEQQARVRETEGRLEGAKANVAKAEILYRRVEKLSKERVESLQAEDDARLQLDSARAVVKEVTGQLDLAKTILDWTIIRSPINGVVLEKLVDPSELVVPQSFGGPRGPSTALMALADPTQLQVEVDISESDLGKVFLNQLCIVSPEAFPDKTYQAYVTEIAPEANRQKLTLQIKVQIVDPNRFLTPELSAKVDFLKEERTPGNTPNTSVK